MHQGARRRRTDGESETARGAAVALLDRGWGRPPQAHTGRDGDGEIRVIIRHLAEGRDATGVRQVIEARPVPVITANGEDDEP